MTAAHIIDGKAFAAGLRERIREAVPAFVKQAGRAPGLAVVLVGEDPASQVYVASKHKATIAAGMESFEHRLPADVAQDDLLALVEQLNADETVDGILVQLPLPKGLDEKAVVMAIDPDKDVDGLHVINAGRLANGEEALTPCTPLGSLMLLKDTLGDLTGLDAVVVGRSILVGKDPEPGKDKGRLVGDVATAEALDHVRAITPVPGGVGPMTIAVLLRNTLVAASARAGLEKPEGL